MTPTEERIRQKLNELPEPYRSQALSQVDPAVLVDVMPNKINSRFDAVYLFSNWSKTKEGSRYWFKFINSLPATDPTKEDIQSDINELQSQIDTLKEQLKQLNNESK